MNQRAKAHRTRWDASAVPPVVWLVGPWGEAEFALTRGQVAPLEVARELLTPAAAIDAFATSPPPEFVLLAQPRPGVWQQADLDRFLAAAPLARVVIVAGSWCEGELRTGRPLAGALRLYWYELAAWWRQTAARRDTGLAPHWLRTPDAAPLGADGTGQRSDAKRVAVDARDYSVYETLAAALGPHGWQAVWTPRGRGDAHGAEAGIWDGGQLDPREVDELREFCEGFGRRPAPVIVLVDFPRPEHFETMREVGAAALLAKPYCVAALLDELARISPRGVVNACVFASKATAALRSEQASRRTP